MGVHDQIFDRDTAIEYFDEHGFNQIEEKDLMDFCMVRGYKDQPILDTWKDHFRSIKVPFAITDQYDQQKDRKIPRITLWKCRRI